MTSSISSSSNPVVSQQRSIYIPLSPEEKIEKYKTTYKGVQSSDPRSYPHGKPAFFREIIECSNRYLNCDSVDTKSKHDLVELFLTLILEEKFSFTSPYISDPMLEIINLLKFIHKQNEYLGISINNIIFDDRLFTDVGFFAIVHCCWKNYCNNNSTKTEHRNDLAKLILIMALEESLHFASSPIYDLYDPFSKNDLSLITLNLFKDLYNNGASPNILINEILFNNKSFKEIEFFQIVYLYWKTYSENPLSAGVDQGFSDLCKEMIRDPRTDLNVKFFESQNASPHFVPQTGLHAAGYTFESTTLAHYALAIKDRTFAMLMANSNKRRLLPKCTLIREPVERITNISLLHIAARTKNTGNCCLIGKDPNNMFENDSSQDTPLAYLQKSDQDELIRKKTVSTLSVTLTPESSVQEEPLSSASQMIIRPGYVVLYNLALKTAHYVYHRLTLRSRSMSPGEGKRDGLPFHAEPKVPPMHRGSNSDYTHSGYDRGHLAPAADFTRDSDIADSFFLSNICPQDPTLNQGPWKKLETLVRLKVLENDAVDVYTGPIFDSREPPVPPIGKNALPVPTHLFKIIQLHNHGSTETIVYKLPNRAIKEKESKKLEDFQTSAEEIQQLTDIAFANMKKSA